MIVLDNEPEVRLDRDTVTVPNLVEVLIFSETFTVTVLPSEDTAIQLSLVEAVNVPSVETETVSVPPSAPKERLSGVTDNVFPFCVKVTLTELALFCIVTVPVRVSGVLFSSMVMVMLASPVPEVVDNVIQSAADDAVHWPLAVTLITELVDADSTVMEVWSTLNVVGTGSCWPVDR